MACVLNFKPEQWEKDISQKQTNKTNPLLLEGVLVFYKKKKKPNDKYSKTMYFGGPIICKGIVRLCGDHLKSIQLISYSMTAEN